MPSLRVNAGFGVLLALTIAIKMLANVTTPAYPDDRDIVSLLRGSGFEIRRAAPNTDPAWIFGTKGRCELKIANVSPQGWHRIAVAQEAAGQTTLFSVEGKLHSDQPLVGPVITDYFRRLERYVGIDASPVRVRAIVVGPQCPTDVIAPSELARLS